MTNSVLSLKSKAPKSGSILLNLLLALFLSIGVYLAPAHGQASQTCQSVFSVSESGQAGINWGEREKSIAFAIMLEGSMKVSRTTTKGSMFFSEMKMTPSDVSTIAEVNFVTALMYVLDNLDSLEANLATATMINKLLTVGLVPEEHFGNPKFRPVSKNFHQADKHIQTVDRFYAWLQHPTAKVLMKKDPVRLAEIIHNTMVAFDSFPDGNGRTSRLMADLILLKSGMAPALYTNMADYFARGNALSKVDRKVRVEYFREITQMGQDAFDQKIKEELN